MSLVSLLQRVTRHASASGGHERTGVGRTLGAGRGRGVAAAQLVYAVTLPGLDTVCGVESLRRKLGREEQLVNRLPPGRATRQPCRWSCGWSARPRPWSWPQHASTLPRTRARPWRAAHAADAGVRLYNSCSSGSDGAMLPDSRRTLGGSSRGWRGGMLEADGQRKCSLYIFGSGRGRTRALQHRDTHVVPTVDAPHPAAALQSGTHVNMSVIMAGGQDLAAVRPAVQALQACQACSGTWTALPRLAAARHGVGLNACEGGASLSTAAASRLYPPAALPT